MTYVLMFCYMESWVLQKSIWMSGQGANVPKYYAMFAWSDSFRFDLMSVWKHPYYYQIKHPYYYQIKHPYYYQIKHPYYYQIKHPYYYQIKHPQYSNHPKKSQKRKTSDPLDFSVDQKFTKIAQLRTRLCQASSKVLELARQAEEALRCQGWGVLGCPRKLGKWLVNGL